jgi:hypothetical protein
VNVFTIDHIHRVAAAAGEPLANGIRLGPDARADFMKIVTAVGRAHKSPKKAADRLLEFFGIDAATVVAIEDDEPLSSEEVVKILNGLARVFNGPNGEYVDPFAQSDRRHTRPRADMEMGDDGPSAKGGPMTIVREPLPPEASGIAKTFEDWAALDWRARALYRALAQLAWPARALRTHAPGVDGRCRARRCDGGRRSVRRRAPSRWVARVRGHDGRPAPHRCSRAADRL